MFKRDKSLFEQLVGRDAGQSPNIMSVPLKLGQLATMPTLILTRKFDHHFHADLAM